MARMELSTVLAPVCTALAVSFAWPQVFKIYRQNTVEGLSAKGTLHGLSGCLLWTLYGAAQGLLPILISNGAVGTAMLMIAAAQIRHRTLRLSHLLALLCAVALVGFAALVLSTTLVGWMAIVVGVTSILPQVVHVSRTVDLSGISLPMYAMILLSGVLWSLYGALIGDWLIVITNAFILPCALYIAFKSWRAQSAQSVSVACSA